MHVPPLKTMRLHFICNIINLQYVRTYLCLCLCTEAIVCLQERFPEGSLRVGRNVLTPGQAADDIVTGVVCRVHSTVTVKHTKERLVRRVLGRGTYMQGQYIYAPYNQVKCSVKFIH